MKWTINTPARARHREVTEKLDKIIRLLEKPTAAAAVQDSIVEVAKELYTTEELCAILRVTRRTLARYRQKKKIPYYMIDRKCYYKADEVKVLLSQLPTLKAGS